MKNIKPKGLVLFDLDGTLLDTQQGIIESIDHTIKVLGLKPVSRDEIINFIGPPVKYTFAKWLGNDEDLVNRATVIFRDYYAREGLYKAYPYPGFPQLLQQLRDKGYILAVATYKREDYSLSLLQNKGLDKYFHIIRGADMEGKLTKSDIIELCIASSDISDRKRMWMIGDTEIDRQGAVASGVNFIGVTYGFGFDKVDENQHIVASAADILRHIEG